MHIDLANVKQAIREGILGVWNGKKFPITGIDTRAKKYCSNIRAWSYNEKIIQTNLWEWYNKFNNEYDDAINKTLFTEQDTFKAVEEQVKKAKYVPDKALSKDELYIQVEPSKKAQKHGSNLPTFIGVRGTESKLEKGHHAIAHFANGGMRNMLADYLGMEGVALYNLRIRDCQKISGLNPEEQEKFLLHFMASPIIPIIVVLIISIHLEKSWSSI